MTEQVIYADIGVNLCSAKLKDPGAILARAWDQWVGYFVSISNSLKECHGNLELCQRFHTEYQLYCTMGVHPHNAKQLNNQALNELRELIQANRKYVVAMGECGLDYDRNFSPPALQRKWFESQIQMAIELKLPLYFHEREAFNDFCQIVEKYDLRDMAVVHCFTGSREALLKYLALGYYIGITGWVCDEKRGQALQKLIPLIPLERLLLETDSPYLTPQNMPQLRARINEPINVYYVAKKVASLYQMDLEELVKITTENARRFFNLKNLTT